MSNEDYKVKYEDAMTRIGELEHQVDELKRTVDLLETDTGRAVEAEREACARVIENGAFLSTESNEYKWAQSVARAIRARGDIIRSSDVP